MSLFSKVGMYCNVCGLIFLTDFTSYGGRVCSDECQKELTLRRSCAILGDESKLHPYEPPDREWWHEE